MAVHARAVVSEDRLGHERHGLAVLVGDALDDVLEQHQPVGRVQQRAELHVDLGLTRTADLMVLHLDLDARVDQGACHLRAQVGVVVGRRHREVAALVRGPVAKVAAAVLGSGVPGAFDRVDVVVPGVRARLEPRRVEDVELRLRAEEGRVADAGAAQVLLGLARDVAGVAAIGLAGQRVVHEECQVEGLVGAERVEHRAGRVREEEHVRLVDLLETADRGAIKHQALREDLLVEDLDRHGEMLHRSRQVAESDVYELDVLFCYETKHLIGACEHQPSLGQARISAFIGTLSADAPWTLDAGNFRSVSLVFRTCYA